MAMVRTVFSPRCWATSSTRRLPWFVRLERVENRRQFPVELHVDDGARDLANATNRICHFSLQQMSFRRPTA